MSMYETNTIITQEEKDFLVSEMKDLLEEYDYKYTTTALKRIIDTWATEKADLITHFKKHPNYMEGKFLIAFTSDFSRDVDTEGVRRFANWLSSNMYRLYEYLPEDVDKQRREECKAYLPDGMYCWLCYRLKEIEVQFLDEVMEETINNIFPFAHAHKGQKVSRVVNKICTYLGFSKMDDYNREYAKFADALSPITIKRHTVLSINPLDYLTMSFGNSWASCHTIDKRNKRRMPNSYEGQWSSGTVSYMLDGTSMVFYTVDGGYNGTDYWTQSKINRQMFHWGEEKLIQSRLYPQDNDGNTAGYTPFRNIVQNIMSVIYDFPNLWTFKTGTGPASEFIYSKGTHYRDYNNYNNCSCSRIKGSINENGITVGHDPICIECSCAHDNNENINCCTNYGTVCADCGCTIDDEDDEHWINGEVYCDDCVYYCECCEEYVREATRVDDEWICESCLDEYYTRCDDCDEWIYRDNGYYIESRDIYVCDDCYNNSYRYCEECGEDYHIGDMTWVDELGRYVCDDCAEEKYTCSKCGSINGNCIEHEGNLYCPDCHEEITKTETETVAEAM